MRDVALKEYERKELENQLIKDELQKLAILGLGNAGKTSIVKTVLYQFDDLMSLTPTKGVERTNIEFLGREIVIWDFGGQEQYKEKYFQDPERYFSEIQYLYYVVDTQDVAQLQDSIDYFLEITEFLAQYSPKARVYIYFHKIDPEYDGNADFHEIENLFLEQTLPIVQRLITHPPTVFHTSIHNIISVVSGFAQPLLSNEKLHETLTLTIRQFCNDSMVNYGMLFAENFFEIANYTPREKHEQINAAFRSFIAEWDVPGFDGKFPDMGLGYSLLHIKKFLIPVGDREFSFYLVLGIDNTIKESEKPRLTEKIDNFVENLKNILRNAEIIRIGKLRTDRIVKSEYFDDF